MTVHPEHTEQRSRSAAAVAAGPWPLDVTRSTASFSVRNFGLRTVRGRVPIVSATADVDHDGRVTAVRAMLDLAAIDTANARRDRDLAAPKLLDTGRYPTLTFTGGPAESSATGWRVPGRLAGHGAWTDVVLEVSGTPAIGGDRATVVAHTRFDRRWLGVRAPRFMIGHEVTVEIRADLVAPER